MLFEADETFEPFEAQALAAVFPLYKRALYPFIEEAFGWNEAFQRERVQRAYPLHSLYWARYGKSQARRGALVSVQQQDGALHLHLLMVLENLRSQGIGQGVMQALHQQATQHQQVMTLSCFKNNPRALQFYHKLGYEVTAEDAHFFDLIWYPSKRSTD